MKNFNPAICLQLEAAKEPLKRKAAILEDRRLYMPFLLPFN